MPTTLLLLLLAQASPVTAGIISGHVVDGVTGKPVAAAVVAIGGSPLVGLSDSAQPPHVLTGSAGQFEFRNLEPGVYGVTVRKGGYAEGEPGRRRAGGSALPIVLSAAEPSADVTVPMWRYSALAGTVTDEAGEPLIALQVQVLMRSAGRRQFEVLGLTFTDDRGAYRFGSLLPGEYLIVASPPPVSATASLLTEVQNSGRGSGVIGALWEDQGLRPGATIDGAIIASGRGTAKPAVRPGHRVLLYPPTFYPSAFSPAQASRITLGAGEERSNLDLQLLPVTTVRVSGVLLDGGNPSAMTAVRLVPAGGEDVSPDVTAPSSISDASGAFTFAAVPPGSYALRTSTGAGTGVNWIDMPIAVGDEDIDGLVVVLRRPLRVTGRSRFDGASPPPAGGRRAWIIAPFSLDAVNRFAAASSIAATFGEEGEFTLIGHLPGWYRVIGGPPLDGWVFKAAMLDGVDVSERPFELKNDVRDLTIIYTDRPSSVSGRIDPTGVSGSVLLFPADASMWPQAAPSSPRIRLTRANARGEFSIANVPPGDYLMLALTDEPPPDWRDASSLDALARTATRVSIAEGERKTVVLRAADGR